MCGIMSKADINGGNYENFALLGGNVPYKNIRAWSGYTAPAEGAGLLRRGLYHKCCFHTRTHGALCDVVHINTLGLGSKRLARRYKRAGKAVVYHAHSTKEDFRNSFVGSNLLAGLYKRWICSCYNSGDVIITPTEYSKRLLLSYGISKPIYAVSNGIDLPSFAPCESDRADFRKKYGFSEQDKVVMSVGLYFERKGILDFVRLAYAMPDHKFIWFGKTPLVSVPFKVRRAVKTKLPNLIFAGYVPPQELKKAYAGADVYIFPTYEETEGIVLLEALASRANVIVRDIPCFDWLKENRDCYKAESCAEFKYKISAITAGRLPRLSENGYAAVADKELHFVGEQLMDIYGKAAACAKIAELP